MSKLFKYLGTACFVVLSMVVWISCNVEIIHIPRGELNIAVEYEGTGEEGREKLTISNLPKGRYEVAMGSFAEHCRMTDEPKSVQIDPKNTAFVSLKMKCNKSVSLANQVVFVYDSLRRTVVYTGDAGSGWTKIKAANISDPANKQAIDRRKVVFSRGGNIWSYNITQKKLRQLTDSGTDSNPDWSPRGSQIAFTSRRDGNAEIYVMNADGSKQRNISNSMYVDTAPDWSPCGMKLVFTSNRDGEDELFIVYPNTQRIRQLTNNTIDEQYALWLSDGRKLLVMSTSWSGLERMHKIDFNGRILETASLFETFYVNVFDNQWRQLKTINVSDIVSTQLTTEDSVGRQRESIVL